MNELNAIKEIKNGKHLNEFDLAEITTLMKIAALCNHKDGIKEVNEIGWDKASARLAVSRDFRNIKIIPKEYEVFCAPELAEWAKQLSMSDVKDYTAIMNNYIDVDTKQRVVRSNPSCRRFFLTDKFISKANYRNKTRSNTNTKIKQATTTNSMLDFSIISGENEVFTLDPTDFLRADIEDKTSEWLTALLDTNTLFPEYFLEALLLPNKRYAAALKSGHEKSAQAYLSQKISYLDKAVCLHIAELHPEAAITYPTFLTREGIKKFWENKKNILSKTQMTYYFLHFPAELLDLSMAEDIIVSLDVLNHAPELFAGTDIAFKFISRNPRSIFDADERFQLEGLLLSGTIILDKDNVEKIKNDELRSKIKLAFNF